MVKKPIQVGILRGWELLQSSLKYLSSGNRIFIIVIFHLSCIYWLVVDQFQGRRHITSCDPYLIRAMWRFSHPIEDRSSSFDILNQVSGHTIVRIQKCHMNYTILLHLHSSSSVYIMYTGNGKVHFLIFNFLRNTGGIRFHLGIIRNTFPLWLLFWVFIIALVLVLCLLIYLRRLDQGFYFPFYDIYESVKQFMKFSCIFRGALQHLSVVEIEEQTYKNTLSHRKISDQPPNISTYSGQPLYPSSGSSWLPYSYLCRSNMTLHRTIFPSSPSAPLSPSHTQILSYTDTGFYLRISRD